MQRDQATGTQETTNLRGLVLETLSPLGPELTDDQLKLVAGGRPASKTIEHIDTCGGHEDCD